MASANFQAFDRTLRRLHMMHLVEQLANERGTGFRASLVVNARTGLPAMPATGEFVSRHAAAVAECKNAVTA